jgi:hypothetical protein
VVRVSPTGVVTAVAPGQAYITASFEGMRTSARVIVAGFAARYQVTSLDGQALPIVLEEWDHLDETGAVSRMIQRLERGSALFDGRYEVEFVLGLYRRTTFQGNVIEQRINQQTIRDKGALEYNWLDGSARLSSELYGNLTHSLRPDGTGLWLGFRIGGTDTIWGVSLRQMQ